ncbi:MAG TPA: nitroreductase [Caulobacteraceae bacterium]|nr:nitroreductase [Caulobacteraceae bacterium]
MPHSVPPAPHFGDPLPGETSPEVLAFLARRRSASAMTLRAPAPSPAELDDLLRLAARVPDHGKLGPWRFVILEGEGKAAYAARLDEIAAGRPDAVKCAAKLGKLKTPPLGIAVVSHVTQGEIPEWEQVMSAAAVCHQLVLAASAMGYGANWITDWYAYDEQARAALGLSPAEKIAGFVFIGTPNEVPLERVRPDLDPRVSRYEG